MQSEFYHVSIKGQTEEQLTLKMQYSFEKLAKTFYGFNEKISKTF